MLLNIFSLTDNRKRTLRRREGEKEEWKETNKRERESK
jgi:hypothetical protein